MTLGGAPPLRWIASVMYAVVLAAGLYFAAAGLAPGTKAGELAGFVVALLALLAVEQVTVDQRVLLVARIGLLALVAAVDPVGFARILFVLVPFFAYFSLGRRWSIGLAAGLLAIATVQVSRTSGWHTDPETVSDLLMFAIGMVLAVATAGVAAEQQRSRIRAEHLVAELSAAQQQVAELSAAAERNRLARDIHDSLGHHLTAISVQLAKAEAFRERDPAVADRAVTDAHRAAGQALREVRESVGTLRSESFSLGTALAALADGLDDPGFRVSVELSGSETGRPRDELEALYRVAQEALTNARRHADADAVQVAVRFGEAATLEVADNGRGFRVGSTDGNGLVGMRERLAALGGVVEIDSAPGRGTRVTASVGGVR